MHMFIEIQGLLGGGKGKEKNFSSGLFMSDSDMMKQELILCDELVTDDWHIVY